MQGGPIVRIALYFGYLGAGRGHGLIDPMQRTWHPGKIPGFPWTEQMIDSGILTSRRIQDLPDGRVFTGIGGINVLWRYFCWWDRSGDHRGSSNSGFYTRGFMASQVREAFEYACTQWPDVVGRQLHKLDLQL